MVSTDHIFDANKIIELKQRIADKDKEIQYLGAQLAEASMQLGRLERRVRSLRGALMQAAIWFTEYAIIHSAKHDNEKEFRNMERANFCENAVTDSWKSE
jgi:uncharacterized coiled-coil protein SlyX